MAKARKLDFPTQLIRSVSELMRALQQSNWRNWPMVFDVPSTSQIFGGIAMDAGIEGIVYDSLLTSRPCLAIFPQNFLNSSSYVELDDQPPTSNIKRRLDSTNFGEFI
jgi:hypothetical protein